MKLKKSLLVLVVSIISGQLLLAQPTPPSSPQPPSALEPGSNSAFGRGMGEPGNRPRSPEVRFNLDFRGGTPAELIAAIEKASDHPVNAVIPVEHADMQLPPLKMKQVTVPQLFEALSLASLKTETYVQDRQVSRDGQVMERKMQMQTSYGFKSASPGPDAIWYFEYKGVNPPSAPPSVSRFYNLDLAGKAYTIQDITTAIKTGWDLLGIEDQPTLKYHSETKLLIAVGKHEHLLLIDSVLRELDIRPDAPKKNGDSSAK